MVWPCCSPVTGFSVTEWGESTFTFSIHSGRRLRVHDPVASSRAGDAPSNPPDSDDGDDGDGGLTEPGIAKEGDVVYRDGGNNPDQSTNGDFRMKWQRPA